MKLAWFMGAALAIALLAVPPQSADVRLRAAQQKETVEGNLQAAIAMYRNIADDRSTPPEIAARALLRLGKCYQRMGSAEARKAYKRVLAQFGGQEAAVAEAKQLLAAMNGNGGTQPDNRLIVRKLLLGVRDSFPPGISTRDGKYVAATRGRSEVDLVNISTGERTRVRTQQPIVSGNEYIYVSWVSPDGQNIVVDVPTGSSTSEVRIIDRPTGRVRTLFKSDSGFRVLLKDWSSDGRTLLVQAGIERGPHLIDTVSGSARSISVSGEQEDEARLSPDGQFIAYTVFPPNHFFRATGKIYVERIDGSADQLIAAPEGGAMLAGWSPDGRYLLFTSSDLGNEQLWAVRVQDGRAQGEPISLAKGLPQGTDARATANGSIVVFIAGSIRAQIAQINPATGVAGAPRDVNPQVKAWTLNPAWSPDGRYFVYSVHRGDEQPLELFLRDEQTSELRRLGPFPAIPRKLSWAPDGQSLLMPHMSARDAWNVNASSLFRYWLSDGRKEQIVAAKPQDPPAKAHPKLAADGQTLFYLEGPPSLTGCKLIRYDLASGMAKSIAYVNHTYDLAPGGGQLVIPFFDSSTKTMTIRVIDRDGQPVRELVRLQPEERVTSLAWSPDGKWIYFARGTRTGVEIHRVPATGGTPATTGLRTGTWVDLVVHPNGTQLAYLDRGAMEVWRVDGIKEALARLP